MSYCDTCCHQYSDICGTCETLEGVPVKYVNVKYKNDYPCNECANNRNINGICAVCIKPENGRPTKYKTKEEELKENEKKKTHYDEVRAMSVEELAEWFFTSMYDMGIQCNPCRGAFDCKYCLLEWLKQEVSDDS